MKELCFAFRLYACDDVVDICREQIHFILRGRECIRQSLQDGADAARVLADAAQGFDDCAVLGEDDVAVFADELEGERARDDASAARDDVDVEVQDAVAPLLTHGGDASRFELLAQHHAERRRLGRVLGGGLDDVRRRIGRVRVDVEEEVFARLTDRENNGLFVGLGDLVDAPAREGVRELRGERGHGESVKAHSSILLS